VRPALVLLDPAMKALLPLPLPRNFERTFDLPLQNWREAGLNAASTARIHKLTVLAKDEIVRRIGALSNLDQDSLMRVLGSAFCVQAKSE